MPGETQQAPRVAHHQSSMADAAAAVGASAAAPLIDQFSTFKFNGSLVFGYDADSIAVDSLRKAHSVAIALSILVDSDEVGAVHRHHLAGAIDAIGTLVGLAAVGVSAAA